MTQAARSPAAGGDLAQRAGATGRRGRAGGWRLPEQVWVAGVPALVTLVVTLDQMSRPSLWRDEGATLAAVHRSLPQLIRMLGNVDAVHGAYYVAMWFWVRAAGYGVVAVRLPSAVAMVVAAAATAVIGRRLVSGWAGLWAGLVFAAVPDVTWYAQNAREYAIVAAVAVVTSYLLVRVIDAEPGARRRWLVGYGVAVAALGWASVLAVLLIPAHGVAVLAARRRGRGLLAGWLAAVAAAAVTIVPLVIAASAQQNQVSWIKPPRAASFVSAGRLIGFPSLMAALVLVTLAGVAFAALRPGGRLRAAWPGGLVALAGPWLVLPFALLLGISLIHPLYQPRYLVYCIPAAALLAGAGLAALGRVGGAAALAVVVVVALPIQADVRHAGSHGENLRMLSRIIAAQERPGDAVLFAGRNTREFEAAYPAAYRPLLDVGLGRAAVESGTLTGTNAPSGVVRARLAGVSRVWVVETGATRGSTPVLDGLGFTQARKWSVSGIWLVLFVK